ncbi:hypothetical protein U1Q18_035229 [Sarracenia purpurea var. burkii]
MDLETENRIAAILMKEAAELRRQAEKEGVHVYLRQPKFRGRPNSRFLTATVLGVQQANRAVEVNEMWRVRQKEINLDDRLKGRLRDDNSSGRSNGDSNDSQRSGNTRHTRIETTASVQCSSSKRVIQDCSREDEGFKDDEIDEFLHSRVKRGRGAVGSWIDETGPHLPPGFSSKQKWLASRDIGCNERWDHRIVLGPEKPSLLKTCQSSSEVESLQDKPKKAHKVGSSKRHSRKHKSKEKSRDKKKKKREEKRHKHHK